MESELLILAKQILKVNDKCALSGSLALNNQGIRTKREPEDIDIYLPKDVEFILIPGMIENDDFNKDDYRNDEWIRTQYIINKIKVDVFTPQVDFEFPLVIVRSNRIDVVRTEEIIKFKVAFAFDDHSSAEKHRVDVIYMMENANNPLQIQTNYDDLIF